jgi:hypothetical protein
MRCSLARLYFDDYLTGLISTDIKDALENHLASCPECRRELESDKRLLALLKMPAVPDPGEKYWDDLDNVVLSRTFDEPSEYVPVEKGEKLRHAFFLRYIIPAAASILILIAAMYGVGRQSVLSPRAASAQTGRLMENADYFRKTCPGYELKPDIVGMAMLSLPGTLGRNAIMIEQLTAFNDRQGRL